MTFFHAIYLIIELNSSNFYVNALGYFLICLHNQLLMALGSWDFWGKLLGHYNQVVIKCLKCPYQNYLAKGWCAILHFTFWWVRLLKGHFKDFFAIQSLVHSIFWFNCFVLIEMFCFVDIKQHTYLKTTVYFLTKYSSVKL